MKGREVKMGMKKEKEMLESIKSKYNALICEYEIKKKDAIKENDCGYEIKQLEIFRFYYII